MPLAVDAQRSAVVDAPAISLRLPAGYDEGLDAEPLRDFAIAPDGRAVAFVKVTAKRTVIMQYGDASESDFLEATAVWLASAPQWAPRRIVHTAGAPSTLSQLQWSADGRYLAVVATLGTRSRVLLWDRRRQAVTTTSPCVSTGVAGDQVRDDRVVVRFQWLRGDRGLLLGESCDTDAMEATAFGDPGLMGTHDAVRAWAVRAAGRRPAVSVLHGGVPADSMPIAPRALWLLDPHTGASRRLAKGPYDTLVVQPGDEVITLVSSFGAPPPAPDRPAPYVDRPQVVRRVSSVLRLDAMGAQTRLSTMTAWVPKRDRSLVSLSGTVADSVTDDLPRMFTGVLHSEGIAVVTRDSQRTTRVLVANDSLRRTWFVVACHTGSRLRCAAYAIGAIRRVPDRRPLAISRSIRYQSERGDALVAYVTLPIGYIPGRRYPVVVDVYPGYTHEGFPGDSVTHAYSWAGYGYIELLPEQPYVSKVNHPDLAISQVTLGVLPAIDTIVHMGLADSTRIGVWGLSFGAYTVYALLTTTNRFHAAIAMAGPANALSWWGSFMPYDRYSQNPEYEQAPYWYTESGQLNLSYTPWQRPDLYIKNSPFFAVDKITTPLLIEQGDQDFVSIAQGEQMFNALRRLGRRVDFVRYWGEGHKPEGYWNGRDWDRRQHEWFAHFLGGSVTPVAASRDTTGAGSPSD